MRISQDETVRVTSRRGSIRLTARITERVRRGEIFIPMHYAEAAVNVLTNNEALDAFSKTPEFKITAVKVERLAQAG
ncbi:MAG TPA: hypothetical protein DCS42_06740 [Nitrospiraceae bacterium]|nr:hypothetical protein [Nitrospiraceae bacterium]